METARKKYPTFSQMQVDFFEPPRTPWHRRPARPAHAPAAAASNDARKPKIFLASSKKLGYY
jgi:hypothetical protein